MKVEAVHNESMNNSCEISKQEEEEEEEEEENVSAPYEHIKDPNEDTEMEEGQEQEYEEISDREEEEKEEEEVEDRGEYEIVRNPDSDGAATDEDGDYLPMHSSHAA